MFDRSRYFLNKSVPKPMKFFRSLSRRFVIALSFLFSVLPVSQVFAQQYWRTCSFSVNDCYYEFDIYVNPDNTMTADGIMQCDGMWSPYEIGTGLYGGCPGNPYYGSPGHG